MSTPDMTNPTIDHDPEKACNALDFDLDHWDDPHDTLIDRAEENEFPAVWESEDLHSIPLSETHSVSFPCSTDGELDQLPQQYFQAPRNDYSSTYQAEGYPSSNGVDVDTSFTSAYDLHESLGPSSSTMIPSLYHLGQAQYMHSGPSAEELYNQHIIPWQQGTAQFEAGEELYSQYINPAQEGTAQFEGTTATSTYPPTLLHPSTSTAPQHHLPTSEATVEPSSSVDHDDYPRGPRDPWLELEDQTLQQLVTQFTNPASGLTSWRPLWDEWKVIFPGCRRSEQSIRMRAHRQGLAAGVKKRDYHRSK